MYNLLYPYANMILDKFDIVQLHISLGEQMFSAFIGGKRF